MMIGFVGARRVVDLKDGRLQQRIHCRTPDEVAHWKGIYPDGEKFRAVMVARGTMRLNASKAPEIIFQTNEEEAQWRGTFPQSGLFNHYARWETPNVLILGCEPMAQPEAAESEESPEEKWRSLSDAKLRTEAAKIGLPNIDPKEGREMLIARMKKHVQETVKA